MSNKHFFIGNVTTNLDVTGSIMIKNSNSRPRNARTNHGQIWVKDDNPNELYFSTNTGVDIQITSGSSLAGGGGGGSSSNASTITVSNENTDTSCNILFTTAETGNLEPKTGSNLTFNSNSGTLSATDFSGNLTGNVTGNVTGNSSTVTNGIYTTSSVTDLSDVDSVGSGSIITTTERNKLNDIEANADATDSTNVEAAGAVMTTTNQVIGGFKTFSNIIGGGITGNAATATTSTNLLITMDNSTNQSHRLTFTTDGIGNLPVKNDDGLLYNPSTGKITASGFIGDLEGNVTGTISDLSNKSTDNLTEGSTNLYYTDARVNTYLTNNTYATQSFVNTAVANIIDSAPTTLDTLNELAAALGDDSNFSTTIANSLGTKLNTADFSTNFDTSLSQKNTDDVTEGTNLYFTDARARGAISASGSISYNSSTGAISFTQRTDAEVNTLADARIAAATTDDVTEGSNNQYFTNARADARIAVATTDDVTEGSNNLYFTNARARGAISASGNISYNSSTGAISFTERTDSEVNTLADARIAAATTDDVTEGSNNLYYTDARARGAISASGNISYNSSTGAISFTERTDAEVNTLADARIAAATTDDVTEGSNNLYFTNARVQTISINNVSEDTTPQLGGNLDGNGHDILLTDNNKVKFGTGADLEIYHNGNNSYIDDIGTGSLFIRSGTIYIQNVAGSKTSIATNSGGGQSIYYNNLLKLETTSVGAKVTGDLEVTGDFNTATTDNLSEGSANLYYTDARVNTYLTNNTYATQSFVNTAVANIVDSAPTTLDTLNELAAALGDDSNFSTTIANSLGTKLNTSDFGSTFDTRLSGKSTDSLSEGSNNLYFTNARARGGISASGSISYNSSTGAISFTERTDAEVNTLADARIAAATTDDVTEGGNNLYFTNARARGAISASGSISYNSSTGAISFTERTDSEVNTLADARIAAATTDDVTEGSNNLYYTDARADARVAAGNSATATKIASIINTNIVQLTTTQTLENKTLTTVSSLGFTNSISFTPSTNTLTLSGLAYGGFTCDGDITAFKSSDKRLKDNIKPIEEPLVKIKRIGGYHFEWNKLGKETTNNKGKDIGVIAQEVEGVLPEIVTTRTNGYKAVLYEKIVPLLIECIKEQQNMIEELRVEMEELKS